MYDLINDWNELETLKNQGWEIDRHFDRELNEYEFTFILNAKPTRYDGDEVFKITVRFSIRNGMSSASTYIETFNAWTTEDTFKGIEALQIIHKKSKQFDEYSIKNHYIPVVGRT